MAPQLQVHQPAQQQEKTQQHQRRKDKNTPAKQVQVCIDVAQVHKAQHR
jgi:hypothetical protein